MKRKLHPLIYCIRFIGAIAIMLLFQTNGYAKPRGQWTEKQAWEWEKKHGVIKGFNAPQPAYPGMPRIDILRKAASLGYNSVRIWIPIRERATEFLQSILDEAAKCNMTVSPVLSTNGYFNGTDPVEKEKQIKSYLQNTVGKFKDDPRVIFWDVANEPALKYSFDGKAWEDGALKEISLVKDIVKWTRELGPTQPITTSALFLTEHVYNNNKVHDALKELGAMSDIHNFHLYDLSVDRMKALDVMVAELKKLGNRPIVCTEIVGRTRGGTFARSLTAFSKYHIHFYNWGLYTSDSNWDAAWGLSSFEPYEPWFHDVLHPDGDPYEWRDLEWIRTFHFAKEGEQTEPGAEVTERWDKWRAWKWMVSGPVKGLYYVPKEDGPQAMATWAKGISDADDMGYNGLRLKLSYNEWKKDSTAFYKKTDTLLGLAGIHNMRVTPALLNDDDAGTDEVALSTYVSQVVKKYGYDTRILAWELYTQPGKQNVPKEKLRSILALIFRVARFEFIDQPLTATPVVKTADFAAGFDYKAALIHGKRGGWNRLEYEGSADAELCNYIWSLSDVLSFNTDKKMPETGWLLSVVNRYGRPMICTGWNAPDDSSVKETLGLFARNQVFWYNAGKISDVSLIKSFRFTQISTPRR